MGRSRPSQYARSGAFSSQTDDRPGKYPTPSSAIGRWGNEVERFDVLDAYEANEWLYKKIAAELAEAGYEGYNSFRNPVSRLIGLYKAKLTDRLIDSLDTGGNVDMKTQILQLYEWSNWVDRSEQAARDLVARGILFTKWESVREDEDDPNSPFVRIQRNLIDPRNVIEFEMDGRDILTFLRIDTPYELNAGTDEAEERVKTELWDKRGSARAYRVWDHDLDQAVDLEELTNDRSGHVTLVESATLASPENALPGEHITGWDFIPVVCRRLNVDQDHQWGRSVFQHALDPIDEVNRQATKLAQMMFPPIYAALEKDTDAPRGGNLPKTYIQREGESITQADQDDYKVVDISGINTALLPQGTKLSWSFPQLDFSGHVEAMDSFTKESIEKDLPELAFFRIREWTTPPSGVAVETLTDDIKSRILGVRRKFEDNEVRLNKMGLTMARNIGLAGFENVGDYQLGELDHRFKPYALFPKSRQQNAEEAKAEADAITAMASLPDQILRRFLEGQGYEPEAIESIIREVKQAAQSAQAGAASAILQNVRAARTQTAIAGTAVEQAGVVASGASPTGGE